MINLNPQKCFTLYQKVITKPSIMKVRSDTIQTKNNMLVVYKEKKREIENGIKR